MIKCKNLKKVYFGASCMHQFTVLKPNSGDSLMKINQWGGTSALDINQKS